MAKLSAIQTVTSTTTEDLAVNFKTLPVASFLIL